MTTLTPGGRPTLHVSFSGGEARGYAHVGTLQAIEALGLRVTEVSGSSIGAFVAALVAGGYSAARLADLGTTLRRRDFLRYAWPERRIVANWCRRRAYRQPPGWWSVRACRRTVGRLLGGARFRDLRLPCTIQVTDLTHGRPIGFTRRPIPTSRSALAVSASMALPGLMTPVRWDGRALADGGAFVHLRRLGIGADRVVVSDVSRTPTVRRPITSLAGASAPTSAPASTRPAAEPSPRAARDRAAVRRRWSTGCPAFRPSRRRPSCSG